MGRGDYSMGYPTGYPRISHEARELLHQLPRELLMRRASCSAGYPIGYPIGYSIGYSTGYSKNFS